METKAGGECMLLLGYQFHFCFFKFDIIVAHQISLKCPKSLDLLWISVSEGRGMHKL